MTSKGGPKTKQGKLISSKNAMKHGLTAKNWLNPDEQDFYNSILSKLSADYEPEGILELMQVERIASCVTRLQRIHIVEDALYSLAKTTAQDPQRYLDQWGFTEEHWHMTDNFAELKFGTYQPRKEVMDPDLRIDLFTQNYQQVSSWQELKELMPSIYGHLIEESAIRGCTVKEYIKHYSAKHKSLPIIRIQKDDDQYKLAVKKAAETGDLLSERDIAVFLDALKREIAKHEGALAMVKEYSEILPVFVASAQPQEKDMARINRERTSNERLLSKTIGELLEMQRLRKRRV